MAGACGAADPTDMEANDPCAIDGVVTEGEVELGLTNPFSPAVDGQEATVELSERLWRFVGTARVHGMDVGPGVESAAIDARVELAGAVVSLAVGCRAREFVAVEDGDEMVMPYYIALVPGQVGEGVSVTIVIEVRDRHGRFATDRATVVAHYPP